MKNQCNNIRRAIQGFPATKPPTAPGPSFPTASEMPPIPAALLASPALANAFVQGASAANQMNQNAAEGECHSCSREPTWPDGVPTSTAELAHPTGVPFCAPEATASEVSSNCLPGPTDETACTRAKRMLKHSGKVYTATATKNTFGATTGLGFSPYTAAEATEDAVFIVNIPHASLAACLRISEIKVTVVGPLETDFNYAEGPVGMANGRAVWDAVDADQVVSAVSQEGAQKTGRKLVSTDSVCACDAVWAFNIYDEKAQLEFTVPGLTAALMLATTSMTIRYEVERIYATLDCAFPKKCGETTWAEPSATAAS